MTVLEIAAALIAKYGPDIVRMLFANGAEHPSTPAAVRDDVRRMAALPVATDAVADDAARALAADAETKP